MIMEDNILSLLNSIYECQSACKYCFNACLEEERIDMMRRCIKRTVECAEICEHTASSLAYTDDFTHEVLSICIKACEECAAECRKHNHLHCMECAKSCSECAEACHDYMDEYRKIA